MRGLVAIVVVVLMASSPAGARKASHQHSKRAPANHQMESKTDPAGVARHPDDIALDRKIGSICRGC